MTVGESIAGRCRDIVSLFKQWKDYLCWWATFKFNDYSCKIHERFRSTGEGHPAWSACEIYEFTVSPWDGNHHDLRWKCSWCDLRSIFGLFEKWASPSSILKASIWMATQNGFWWCMQQNNESFTSYMIRFAINSLLSLCFEADNKLKPYLDGYFRSYRCQFVTTALYMEHPTPGRLLNKYFASNHWLYSGLNAELELLYLRLENTRDPNLSWWSRENAIGTRLSNKQYIAIKCKSWQEMFFAPRYYWHPLDIKSGPEDVSSRQGIQRGSFERKKSRQSSKVRVRKPNAIPISTMKSRRYAINQMPECSRGLFYHRNRSKFWNTGEFERVSAIIHFTWKRVVFLA